MIQLYNDDCLNIMRDMPDNSVDLICTDPPYYSTALAFDKQPRIDFEYWLKECKRVLKPAGVLVSFADFNLLANLRSKKIFKSSYELIWQKNQPQGFLDANVRPLRNHEFIGIFTDKFKTSTYNPQKFNYQSSRFKIGESNKVRNIQNKTDTHYSIVNKKDYIEFGLRHPLSVLYCQNWNGGMALKRKNGQERHPTQKPIDLVEWLIKTYSNDGDIVLDCFAGSGTTGVACQQLNRQFIGIELNPEYFEIAQKRIKNAQHQMTLCA